MGLNPKLRKEPIDMFDISFIDSFQKIKIISVILVNFFINFLSYRLKSLIFFL